MFLGRKPVTSLDSVLKTRGIYFANKGPYSQSYGFSSSQVWMWELDYKEGCMPKNWCFSTVVLEKTLESPLDCKEVQPVHPKGDQFSSVESLIMSDSLQPKEPQHARPPCPSPTPGVYSNSCPLSWWCHPTISSFVVPLLLLPSIFPSIRIFSSESVLRIRWP